MARRRAVQQEQSNVDPNHGNGGSYVNTEEGTRELVERTEDVVPRSVDDVNKTDTKAAE